VRFGAATLDPSRLSLGSAQSSDLTSWISLGALRIAGTVLTVREFVQQMAYVQGVVHAGTPKDALETSLLTARHNEHRLVLNFSEPNLDLLKQIGAVTQAGLQPLFEVCKEKRSWKDGAYPRFVYEGAT